MSYRYVFLDVLTNQVIEEINLFGVYCLRQLNQPGQFNGSFSLDQSGKKNIDLKAATVPGKTWICVEKDGVPVYWGIIWSRTYQSQAKVVELFGWGFEAYPQRQVVESNLSLTGTNTSVFCSLWSDMQSVAGRNLSINIPNTNVGPTVSLTASASDYHYYGDLMDSLANAADGFDWTINVTKTADNMYQKNLNIGFPTLGAAGVDRQVYFEYPGAITNYYQTDSMANAGTNIFVLGQGEGSTMPVAQTTQNSMLSMEGWPRWDFVSSHKEISDQSLIDQIAQQEQIILKPPAPTYKLSVLGGQEPIFGSYGLGDSCTLVITDANNPSPDGSKPGLVVSSRIVGWELRPPDSSQVEEINILLPGDTTNG